MRIMCPCKLKRGSIAYATVTDESHERGNLHALLVMVVCSNTSNAAPEWQARSIGRCSRELTVACPLERLVRLRWCLRPRLFLNVEFERPELFVFLFL